MKKNIVISFVTAILTTLMIVFVYNHEIIKFKNQSINRFKLIIRNTIDETQRILKKQDLLKEETDTYQFIDNYPYFKGNITLTD